MDALLSWTPIPRRYDPLKAGSIDGTDVKPHDHGIVRAMEATYKTNKHVESDPKLTLFVARLSPATTEDKLRQFFSQFGELKSCRLVRDIITGLSKRYGFVEFYDLRDAVEANDANQAYLDDYAIFVDFERERVLPGWIPRRLGGGLGGKKESGQLRFGGRDRPFKKPIVLNKKPGSSHDFEGDPRRSGFRRREYDDGPPGERRHGGRDWGSREGNRWREWPEHGDGRHYRRREQGEREWDGPQHSRRRDEQPDSRRAAYQGSRYPEHD